MRSMSKVLYSVSRKLGFPGASSKDYGTHGLKVTNCSIQLGWIFLARDGFAYNYMGSRPETKKCDFFI